MWGCNITYLYGFYPLLDIYDLGRIRNVSVYVLAYYARTSGHKLNKENSRWINSTQSKYNVIFLSSTPDDAVAAYIRWKWTLIQANAVVLWNNYKYNSIRNACWRNSRLVLPFPNNYNMCLLKSFNILFPRLSIVRWYMKRVTLSSFGKEIVWSAVQDLNMRWRMKHLSHYYFCHCFLSSSVIICNLHHIGSFRINTVGIHAVFSCYSLHITVPPGIKALNSGHSFTVLS